MSTPHPVADTVREVIVAMAPPSTGHDAATVTDEARLREDLAFESVRLIELTVVLEKAFVLSPFRPEELVGVLRVADVVALIEGRVGHQRSGQEVPS